MAKNRNDQSSDIDVVVVLSYFGRADPVACVESVVAGSPEARVLVIDPGSYDGVVEEVGSRWPTIDTLQTGRNLGFAGGMNRGIEWAVGIGAGTITVLNNDTIIPAGAIAALGQVARTGVAVSPEVRYADGSEGRPALRPSQVLAGCCVTATAETWQRIGSFDERYFLNFEDSDWSVRAHRAGIPLVVATNVVIYHKVSASFTGSYSYLGTFYYTHNGLLFGSTRRPWALATRARFLRRHAVPALGNAARDRDWVRLLRQSLMIGSAILAHLGRRYGQAPQSLERLAQSWASTAPAGTD